MALIGTNIGAISAGSYLTRSQETFNKSLQKLSSGSRLANPSDDAAGVAVSANLRALMERLSAAGEGAQNMISFAQTADGFLSTVQSQLTRMGELAQRATDGTLSATDRANYNIEFQKLSSQIDYMTGNATFNGSTIFTAGTIGTAINGSGAQEAFVTSSLGNTTSLGVNGLDISTTAGAQAAISSLTAATQSLSSRRAEVGADISKFNFHIQNIRTENVNVTTANSRIADLDVATESSNLASNNIMLRAGVAMLSQANSAQSSILALLK